MTRLKQNLPPWAFPVLLGVSLLILVFLGWRMLRGSSPSESQERPDFFSAIPQATSTPSGR